MARVAMVVMGLIGAASCNLEFKYKGKKNKEEGADESGSSKSASSRKGKGGSGAKGDGRGGGGGGARATGRAGGPGAGFKITTKKFPIVIYKQWKKGDRVILEFKGKYHSRNNIQRGEGRILRSSKNHIVEYEALVTVTRVDKNGNAIRAKHEVKKCRFSRHGGRKMKEMVPKGTVALTRFRGDQPEIRFRGKRTSRYFRSLMRRALLISRSITDEGKSVWQPQGPKGIGETWGINKDLFLRSLDKLNKKDRRKEFAKLTGTAKLVGRKEVDGVPCLEVQYKYKDSSTRVENFIKRIMMGQRLEAVARGWGYWMIPTDPDSKFLVTDTVSKAFTRHKIKIKGSRFNRILGRLGRGTSKKMRRLMKKRQKILNKSVGPQSGEAILKIWFETKVHLKYRELPPED